MIARGALADAYGPILGDREMWAAHRPLPLRLGNITVRVTDSRGVARYAGLLYTVDNARSLLTKQSLTTTLA